MTNVRTFIVKTIGPSNSKPARIVINDLRMRKTIVIKEDQESSATFYQQAIDRLVAMGIPIQNQSEGKGYMMLHSDNFTNQIK